MRKLNCVLQNALGANRYIMLSQVHALQELGHNVIFWEPDNKPAFDLFYEVEQAYGKVDFFFGNTWRLDRSLVKCLLNRPYVKIVCRAPHLGDWDCDRIKYPIQFADHNEVELVKILSEHPNFNHLTCQYPDDFVQENKTHNGWEQFDLKVTGIPLGLDTTDYFPVDPEDHYKKDWVWVGSRWNYKAVMMDPYLNPLMYPRSNFSHVLIGNGFAGPNSVGYATEETIRKLYASSIACPNVHEPHATFVPDENQRLMQIIGCGGFEICAKTYGLSGLFKEDELFVASSPEEMRSAVLYFVEHQEQRIPWIKKGYLKTYKCHTNFHRLADVANLINEPELAESALKKASEIYQIREDQLLKRFG